GDKFAALFIETIQEIAGNITPHSHHNYFGQILLHHTANSSKYMSIWIEEKTRNKEL
ncbi:MAG: glycosyltransferase, partial [Pedobacter sp.]|nr:glycosyltransferase [Pedobacter sp.]